MNVSQAVESRRSIRQFLPDPVPQEALKRILEQAQRAPSGGNVQPWNAIVVTGAALDRLRNAIAAKLPEGRAGHSLEYDVYPAALEARYAASRYEVGESMYAALGVTREDKAGRLAQFKRNFQAFDAPVLLLVHMPRYMGPPQWSDIGMWLQTIMLLLREEGLDSCAQEAWAVYQADIRKVIAIPDDHLFFCGLAIGYRDSAAAINNFPVARVPLDEIVTFIDD